MTPGVATTKGLHGGLPICRSCLRMYSFLETVRDLSEIPECAFCGQPAAVGSPTAGQGRLMALIKAGITRQALAEQLGISRETMRKRLQREKQLRMSRLIADHCNDEH